MGAIHAACCHALPVPANYVNTNLPFRQLPGCAAGPRALDRAKRQRPWRDLHTVNSQREVAHDLHALGVDQCWKGV